MVRTQQELPLGFPRRLAALRRSPLALLAIAVLSLASLVAGPWPGGGTAHAPPWSVEVSGNQTGVVALGALDPLLSGPGARWLAAAATEGEWSVAPLVQEQAQVSEEAWATAVKLAPANLRKHWTDAPDIHLPSWTGKSAGFAYALAYLDSAPLNPTPGSLMAGRTVAATGVLHPSGLLLPVSYVPAKVAAAQEANADLFIFPSLNKAFDGGLPQDTGTALPAVMAHSLKDAVKYLCATGGTAPVCAWVALSKDSDFLKRVYECVEQNEGELLRLCLKRNSTAE